jgi:hypothetical protein
MIPGVDQCVRLSPASKRMTVVDCHLPPRDVGILRWLRLAVIRRVDLQTTKHAFGNFFPPCRYQKACLGFSVTSSDKAY